MAGTPTFMSTTAVTKISGVRCVLRSITIGTTANGIIDVYNTSSTSSLQATDKIAVIKASTAEQTLNFDVFCNKGVIVKCAAVSKITVVTS